MLDSSRRGRGCAARIGTFPEDQRKPWNSTSHAQRRSKKSKLSFETRSVMAGGIKGWSSSCQAQGA